MAQGYNQRQGADYDETFCPVVRRESFGPVNPTQPRATPRRRDNSFAQWGVGRGGFREATRGVYQTRGGKPGVQALKGHLRTCHDPGSKADACYRKFDIKDLGRLTYFSGCQWSRTREHSLPGLDNQLTPRNSLESRRWVTASQLELL